MDLKAINDPATNLGTARWVALGVAAYDAARHGVSLYNGALLLVLAGMPYAVKLFGQAPPMDPPSMGPTAAA